MLHKCISLIMMVILSNASRYYKEDCDRIRRPIHLLTEEELLLYVEGLQAIKKNGKYQFLADSHAQHTDSHRGPSFFFYHSYFVWEVETQIRKLGGKYECFSLPYYDWTIDAGSEFDPFVLKTVLGGDGDKNNFNCVMDDKYNLWNTDKWPLHELCGETENIEDGCCLKRRLSPTILLRGAVAVGQAVVMSEFETFKGWLVYAHQFVHWLFAKDNCPACAMATGYSPDDPIFMLLHSFISYLRALWASCNGYHKIPAYELDFYPSVYSPVCADGYDECDVTDLDGAYDFGDLAFQDWSLSSSMDITPRKLWDFADWGVQYDVGTFLNDSFLSRSQELCPKINIYEDNSWFVTIENIHNEWQLQHQHQEDYISDIWNEINSYKYADIDESTKYAALMAKECEKNQEILLKENDCFTDLLHVSDNIHQYDTCNDLEIYEIDELDLNDLLSFNGVSDNECLKSIRQTVWNSEVTDESELLILCNGGFDYQCSELPDEFNELTFLNYNLNHETKSSSSSSSNYIYGTLIIVISLFSFIILCHKKCRKLKLIDNNNDNMGWKHHESMTIDEKTPLHENNSYGTTI